jgi:hypothetical protein
MTQRVIILSTGSSNPSLGAGTVHFWVEDLSLSNWGDWNYANGKLGSPDLDSVWAVYLHNERLSDVRIAAWED